MTRVFEFCVASEYADDADALAALTARRAARVIARSTMHEMPLEEIALPKGGDVFRKMGSDEAAAGALVK